MEARFPGLGTGIALDIGSKVAKGEMKRAEMNTTPGGPVRSDVEGRRSRDCMG